MGLVNVAPQHNLYLRETINHLPEIFTIPEANFPHPVSTDIYRVVMQRDKCRQTRVLCQRLGQKIQLGFSQLSEHFSRHGGIQKNKLPATLNNLSAVCAMSRCRFCQRFNVIMVSGKPRRPTVKNAKAVT